MRNLNLTDRQSEALVSLLWATGYVDNTETWARPMDIGGHDSSHHSKTLRQLVNKGLVVRRRRYVGVSGGSWVYALSGEGRRIAEFLAGDD